MSKFSSLSSTSIFISSRCSFSCHSPLCPAPVRPGCLFCLFLSLLSPSSQPPIDCVRPNVALKQVRKPILLNRLSGVSTNTWAVGLARRCRRRFDPRSRSFSLSSTSIYIIILFSFFNVYIYLFALFVQLPFSSLSCAGSSWLPLLLVSFPFFSLFPTPNRPCQSERSSKARQEADSFEPAEWSERLTPRPGQSGWQGAAAVGSIPALALSLFLQRLYSLLFLQRVYQRTLNWIMKRIY